MKEYELNNVKVVCVGGVKPSGTNKTLVATTFVLQEYNWKKKDGPL